MTDNPFKNSCPKCGEPKIRLSKLCIKCYNLGRAATPRKPGESKERKIPCPTCDGIMNWDAQHCRKCWPGRPKIHEYPPTRGQNPHARKVNADHKMAQKLAAEESAERLSPARAKLLKAALNRDEVGGVQKDTEWVYQNLMITWKSIDPAGVPSPGALALLVEAKRDTKWFLQNYHAKLLAVKTKYETEGWFEGDDHQTEEAADECREEILRIAG